MRDHRKPAQVYESKGQPGFLVEFVAEVGVAQMGIFSNQTEFDAIYQLCFTNSFFPTTLHLSPTLFRRFLHIYSCLDIYPETVGVPTIEV